MPVFVTLKSLRYNAMAIYPFIIVREPKIKYDSVIINHELIHHRQQLELLIIPFYILYAANYGVNLIRYRTHDMAYRQIIFEKEAYINDHNKDYLASRSPWAFLRHI